MAEGDAPTYESLVEQNAQLKSYAVGLEREVGRLQLLVAMRDEEIAGLKRPRPAPRALDPDAPSPFDRPYDGR